jgi:hypothetical protein
MRGRKGQLVFEFVIASVFFFYMVFYVINYLNSAALVFANDFYVNSLEFKSLHVSEVLLHSRGTWNGNVPLAPGLAVEWPVLNSTKIQYMDAYCISDYYGLLEKLDVDYGTGHGIRIEINRTGGNMMECGHIPEGIVNTKIERFALSEGNEVLFVGIWAW